MKSSSASNPQDEEDVLLQSSFSEIRQQLLNINDPSCKVGDSLTYISRLIVGLRTNLTKLGALDITNRDLEQWAIFIHESMSIASRNYHSVQHVFDISDGSTDPILIISAFFHDVIYYHVDGCLSKIQEELLDGVFVVEKEGTHNVVLLDTENKELGMVKEIFGFTEPKKELTPMTGLNEFLSAVIAVRVLKEILPFKILTDIAVCIEATIPFRKDTDDGKTPMDLLYGRLLISNEKFDIGYENVDIDDPTMNGCIVSVQRACELANRDVGNFCSEDHTWFLDNTWSLLPETNERLRHQYLYTVKEFHFAVFKMSGFFNFFIKPEVVFVQFYNKPTDEEFDGMKIRCERNLEIGKKYVQAKLLSCSVLVAFAELTGGDAPMSLFMGDLPSRQHASIRLADTLETPSEELYTKHCDVDVYNILQKGRQVEISFDIKRSPLAAYFYAHLGDEQMNKILSDIKVYPMTEDVALQLLRSMPRHTIQSVGENMSKVAVSRRNKIKNVLEKL